MFIGGGSSALDGAKVMQPRWKKLESENVEGHGSNMQCNVLKEPTLTKDKQRYLYTCRRHTSIVHSNIYTSTRYSTLTNIGCVGLYCKTALTCYWMYVCHFGGFACLMPLAFLAICVWIVMVELPRRVARLGGLFWDLLETACGDYTPEDPNHLTFSINNVCVQNHPKPTFSFLQKSMVLTLGGPNHLTEMLF